MPLTVKRLSPKTTGRKAAGSQREIRKVRRREQSPTSEILNPPEDGKRLTRSRSRDQESRGRRPNFYVQEDVRRRRGSNNRSREQQKAPSREETQKTSKKGKNTKKTTAKKTGKTSKATQQQGSPDSEWEDQPDVDPQQDIDLIDFNSSSEGESPTADDERKAEVEEPVKKKKKLQKGSEGEKSGDDIVGDLENSSANGSRVTAPRNQPSTSGSGRITRGNPAGLVPSTTTSKSTIRAPEDQLVDEGDTLTAGDDNSDTESHSPRAESPPESAENKNKKKAQPKYKIKIQLKQKMSSSDRDSASSEDFPSFKYGGDAEVDESLAGSNGRGTEATGAEVGKEMAEVLRNKSATSSRGQHDQPSTSGLDRTALVNNPILSSDEDDEEVGEIDQFLGVTTSVAPENTIIQSSGNTSAGPSRSLRSIFDPDVSLQASDASMSLPDLPTASSTHHHENMNVDEDLEDIVDAPRPAMPPKTPGKKALRFSRVPKEKKEVPLEVPPLPVLEDLESRDEPITPTSNVDMFEEQDESEDTQPERSPLIQARAPSALIPQHLSVDVQERQHINLNTRNSPPPLQGPRPTVILPHTSLMWGIIEEQLRKSCFYHASLKKMILHYNQHKRTEWEFKGLENFFSSMGATQFEDFLHEILPAMKKLAVEMPKLMKGNFRVRQQKSIGSTKITQRGAGCLVANGFFCTFDDEEGRECGGRFLNFSQLFEAFEESEDDVSKEKNRIVKEKLKFIVAYFSTIANERPDGPMRIERVFSPGCPSWWDLNVKLRPVRIEECVKSGGRGVEVIDSSGPIGGDVFGFGAEAEEINSLAHPELLIARLFVEPLGNDEAVFFYGVRKYSNFKGSGGSFRFAGKSEDSGSRDFAYIKWENVEEEKDFERENLISELNKMYVVFKEVERDREDRRVVTVRSSQRPDDQRHQILKFLIVAIAASTTKIHVTFEEDFLNEEMKDLQELLVNENVNIQTIFTGLCEYGNMSWRQRCSSLVYFFRKKLGKGG